VKFPHDKLPNLLFCQLPNKHIILNSVHQSITLLTKFYFVTGIKIAVQTGTRDMRLFKTFFDQFAKQLLDTTIQRIPFCQSLR
jgi:hypothetical protein